MPQIYGFIIGFLVGIVFVYLLWPKKAGDMPAKVVEEPGLLETQAKEKEENISRIVEFFTVQHGPVSNKDIQDLLGVSSATATRYLEELEKEEKIHQVGDSGAGVFYETERVGKIIEDN